MFEKLGNVRALLFCPTRPQMILSALPGEWGGPGPSRFDSSQTLHGNCSAGYVTVTWDLGS